MKRVFFILLVCAARISVAQTGQITIIQDASIDSVLKMYRTLMNAPRLEDGYRVQLGSNINRKVLMDLKAKFLTIYPAVPAYIVYQQPQFKLRVGDFQMRGEAGVFLEEITGRFPGFIVADKILLEGVKW